MTILKSRAVVPGNTKSEAAISSGAPALSESVLSSLKVELFKLECFGRECARLAEKYAGRVTDSKSKSDQIKTGAFWVDRRAGLAESYRALRKKIEAGAGR